MDNGFPKGGRGRSVKNFDCITLLTMEYCYIIGNDL